jgi:hypothetical protein
MHKIAIKIARVFLHKYIILFRIPHIIETFHNCLTEYMNVSRGENDNVGEVKKPLKIKNISLFVRAKGEPVKFFCIFSEY